MSGSLTLAFACPACGRAVETPLSEERTAAGCPRCGAETSLPEADALRVSTTLGPCPVCGSEDLYAQRDFNRKLGIAVVVVGMALGPFTWWISVGVAALVDAVLYLMVPAVAVCYACNAQVRGFAKDRAPPAFDIAVHDAYKFDKRHPPRPERAVAGPLEDRYRERRGLPTRAEMSDPNRV